MLPEIRAETRLGEDVHPAAQMILKRQLEGHKIQQVTLWLEVDEKIEVAGLPRGARGLRTEDPHPQYPVDLGYPPDVRDSLTQNKLRHLTPKGKGEKILRSPRLASLPGPITDR